MTRTLYEQFATWILSDLATRTTENGVITFAGNHSCARYSPSPRTEQETEEQFEFRVDRFVKRLSRGHDASLRLALAAKAFALAGENRFEAAHSILQIARTIPAKKKAEYESQGIGYAFRPIDMPIGTTRRNRRSKEKKHIKTLEEGQAESIRTQVSRFMGKHPDFDAVFERHFGEFRFRFCRDEAWFSSVEPSYAARVAAFEKISGPFDWYAAMPLAVAARFYHEQRKFEAAVLHYRKAIRAARQAVMHESLRDFVLQWLRRGVKLCNHSAKMVPMPLYRGPRAPKNALG